ncbi:MAG: hypothetical protein MH204_08550 [Fimbriimonadaceae bacterium]|nr:hypothetical protein [Fimbriimonadaceae bacterium]
MTPVGYVLAVLCLLISAVMERLLGGLLLGAWTPDLVVAVAMAAALCLRPVPAGVFGLAAGLLSPALADGPASLLLVGMTVLAWSAARLRRSQVELNPVTGWVVIALGMLAFRLIVLVSAGNFQVLTALLPSVGAVLFGAAASIPVYALLRRSVAEEGNLI